MKSRLITFLISIISLVFIVNISRSIYELWQKGSVLSERQEVRDELAATSEELQKKLAEAESPEFIEKQAREKLNLQKEGEVVVVLPKDLEKTEVEVENEVTIPNWQKWWNVFF